MPMKLRDGTVIDSQHGQVNQNEETSSRRRSYSRRSTASKSVLTNTTHIDKKLVIDYTSSSTDCITEDIDVVTADYASQHRIENVSKEIGREVETRAPISNVETCSLGLPLASNRHIFTRSIKTSTPVKYKEWHDSCELNHHQTDETPDGRSSSTVCNYTSIRRKIHTTNNGVNLSDEAFYDLSKTSISNVLRYDDDNSHHTSLTSSIYDDDGENDVLRYMDHEKWGHYHDNRRLWYLNRWRRTDATTTTHRHIVVRIIHYMIIYIMTNFASVSRRTKRQRHTIVSSVYLYWRTTIEEWYIFMSNTLWLNQLHNQHSEEEKSKRRCGLGCCCCCWVLIYFLFWLFLCLLSLVIVGTKLGNQPLQPAETSSTDILSLIQKNWNGKSRMLYPSVKENDVINLLHLPPLHSPFDDATLLMYNDAPALLLITDFQTIQDRMSQLTDIIQNVSSLGYHVIVTPNNIDAESLCKAWAWLHGNTRFSHLFLWAHHITISKVEFASKQLCQKVIPPSGILMTIEAKSSLSNELNEIETWLCQCEGRHSPGDRLSSYLNVKCPFMVDSLYSDLVNCLTTLNQ